MTLIFSLAVLFILASLIVHDMQGGKRHRFNLERNDVVFLRRSYRKNYPNVSSSIPLRIVKTEGKNITVTFMHAEKMEIFEETIMIEALKKVS